MLKRIISLAILFLISQGSMMHPVHVSVTNIDIDAQRMNITVNSFLDDWEFAYFHYYGKKADFKNDSALLRSWVNTYLSESLRIKTESKHSGLVLHTDSIIIEDLSLRIMLHAVYKKEPKSLYLYNSILTDIYADQTNLVIISYGSSESGIKFDYKKTEDEMILK